jgi:hypothetical protein
MTITDDWMEPSPGGGFTFWGLLAIIALVTLLALGCASTKETGTLLQWPAPGWEVQDAQD